MAEVAVEPGTTSTMASADPAQRHKVRPVAALAIIQAAKSSQVLVAVEPWVSALMAMQRARAMAAVGWQNQSLACVSCTPGVVAVGCRISAATVLHQAVVM